MKNTLTYIIIFISSTLFSKTPVSYYSFSGINIEALYPFSKQESKIFKEKGVKKIEITSSYDNLKSYYILNNDGLISSVKTVLVDKKGEKPYGETLYIYNTQGLITSIQSSTPYELYIDSLAYDNKGRLIYYYTSLKSITNKKKYSFQNYSTEYTLLSSNDNGVILSNKLNSLQYFLNNKNECVKIFQDSSSTYSVQRIDSVAYEYFNDSTYNKNFYYKTSNDSTFKLGQSMSFKNNVIINIKIYNTIGLNTNVLQNKTFIYYDDKLYREEYSSNYNNRLFYTYYINSGKNNDLLREKIKITENHTFITSYKYIIN